jgi:hypothetical protein
MISQDFSSIAQSIFGDPIPPAYKGFVKFGKSGQVLVFIAGQNGFVYRSNYSKKGQFHLFKFLSVFNGTDGMANDIHSCSSVQYCLWPFHILNKMIKLYQC